MQEPVTYVHTAVVVVPPSADVYSSPSLVLEVPDDTYHHTPTPLEITCRSACGVVATVVANPPIAAGAVVAVYTAPENDTTAATLTPVLTMVEPAATE